MSRLRFALSPDGYQMAIAQPGDSWFWCDVPSRGRGFVSDLPKGWIEYAPATERDRLADAVEQVAEELESAASSLSWLQDKAKRDTEGGVA